MFIYADEYDEAVEKFFEELADDEALIDTLKELQNKSSIEIEYGRPHFYERGGCEDSVDETLGYIELSLEDIINEIGCEEIISILLEQIGEKNE